MNEYIIIDPCYLRHEDQEWNDYINRMWINHELQFTQGELVEVFPNIKGYWIDNGYGDISAGELKLLLDDGYFEINLPFCDAGHHVIFNKEDILDRLPRCISYGVLTEFSTYEKLEDLMHCISIEPVEDEWY